MTHCPIQNSDDAGILLDYCARKLTGEASIAFEQHIKTCPDCLRFADAQRSLWNALDNWQAEPVSADFDRCLYSRIDEHDRSGWWTRTWAQLTQPFGWKAAMPLTAACATLALAFVLYRPTTTPAPALNENTRIEVTEAEQVERTLEDLEMLKQLAGPAGAQSI